MSYRNLLDSTCAIKRETPGASDGMGGYGTPTLTTLHSNVPCRFETLTKKLEIIAYDKEAVYPDYYVYMEYKSGVQEGDLVVKGSRSFKIKLVENWSEQDEYMKLAVVEHGRSA